MRSVDLSRMRLIGAGAAFVGAVVSAQMAWLHARALGLGGVICGDATPHCAWCPSAIALAALGMAGLFAEWRADRARTAQAAAAAVTIPARRPS